MFNQMKPATYFLHILQEQVLCFHNLISVWRIFILDPKNLTEWMP